MMRKLPLPSVTVVRTFSISAGLVTSTVTPGSTAPDESVTTPATDALIVCASVHAGASTTQTTRMKSLAVSPPAEIDVVDPRSFTRRIDGLHGDNVRLLSEA